MTTNEPVLRFPHLSKPPMQTDDAHDGATRPSRHPDAHHGESNRDAYSHLRAKRRRRSLLTAADVAVLEQRRAAKVAGVPKAKKRKGK